MGNPRGGDESAVIIDICDSDAAIASDSAFSCNSYSSSTAIEAVYTDVHRGLTINMEQCILQLDKEREKLEKGLYRLPKNGLHLQVPAIFRRALVQAMVARATTNGSFYSMEDLHSNDRTSDGYGADHLGGRSAAYDPSPSGETVAMEDGGRGGGSDVDVQEIVSREEMRRILEEPSDLDEDNGIVSPYISSDEEG